MSRSRKPPSSPRHVALDLLQAVLHKRRPLDEALDSEPRFTGLDPRDRAFVRLLAGTTLRRLGQIDAVIAPMLDSPLPSRGATAGDVLRLGAAQMLFLDTPPHAAISTSVEMLKGTNQAGYAGLVNAVLRRIDREGRQALAQTDAAMLNTPDWLWRSWAAAYGEETARAIAEANMTEAPLDITAKGDPAAWAEALGAELLPAGTLRRPAGGDVTHLPGFAEGAWWVQDCAAALPARLLGNIQGKTVADLCAAPGGKTMQMAAAGALVTALDRSGRRLGRLRGNLRRMGLEATLVEGNAETWTPPQPFAAILLDAPCSATGTLRRHPDVAWLKTPGDVTVLALAQARLLNAALAMLAPGGTLVYCVCSLQPEEGERQIETLLAAAPRVRRRPIAAAEIGGLAELITAEGDLRCLPCHLAGRGGMDAFFAARLEQD